MRLCGWGLSPRVRGTFQRYGAESLREGLSPRVRGNPPRRSLLLGGIRSIPARAGEPGRCAGGTDRRRVYPRACGGTACPCRILGKSAGLSPRVRGNQRRRRRPLVSPGSIPARAGEPLGLVSPHCGHWVYPRACGGTELGAVFDRSGSGLSPRVRGNPQGVGHREGRDGSIPARAGEPAARTRKMYWIRVYPRACGGTANAVAKVITPVGVYPRACGGTHEPPAG